MAQTVKNLHAGDPRSIPGSERFPREENGNPLQCACLENSMDRGARRATVHGVTELDGAKWSTLVLEPCIVSNSTHSGSRLPLISIWKPVYSLITGNHCFPLYIIIALCVVYHIYYMYVVHMYRNVCCIHIQHTFFILCQMPTISINIYVSIYFIQENEVDYINSEF